MKAARWRLPWQGASGRRRLKRVLLLAAAVAGLVCVCCERGLSSLSEELTQEAARGYVLEQVHRAVDAELESGEGSYITVERDGEGQVTGVTADAAGLNRLKAGILERLSQELNGRARVGVPVGSLTPIALLNGRGFRVPVAMQFEGSADLCFETSFLSAGVNQSLYRLTMRVDARVYSQSRRFSAYVAEGSETVLAETVVVGSVPLLWGQASSGDS